MGRHEQDARNHRCYQQSEAAEDGAHPIYLTALDSSTAVEVGSVA